MNIIVFKAPEHKNTLLVKRCVALPGDTFQIKMPGLLLMMARYSVLKQLNYISWVYFKTHRFKKSVKRLQNLLSCYRQSFWPTNNRHDNGFLPAEKYIWFTCN